MNTFINMKNKEMKMESKHLYPAARADQRPTPWWYFGRAVYVSRRDYRKIFDVFVAAGVVAGTVSILARAKNPLKAPLVIAGVGLALLGLSLAGLYRMYGHPAVKYLEQLIRLGRVTRPQRVADLHIGTYRHAYLLADLLPTAQIVTVDCWNVVGPPAEEAVQDVRALEPPPLGHPRIQPERAENFKLPLESESVDVVSLGFGTHEIPAEDGSREALFLEARRILKPGGTLLLFEHGYDFHNYVIFGPVIGHVTRKEDWLALLGRLFEDVRYQRSDIAVDLFAARKPEA